MAWNGSSEAMVEFQERHGLTFPNLRDADGSVFARFEVPYQPAFVFVDAAGGIERVVGSLDEADLDERLATLSAGTP